MKTAYTEDPNRPGERRALGWLPNRTRHLLISFLGEFIGTFLFLFFAFAATQTANNLLSNRPMDIESLMYISLAFGFSLAVNVWVFFRVSGGLFNPAVGSLPIQLLTVSVVPPSCCITELMMIRRSLLRWLSSVLYLWSRLHCSFLHSCWVPWPPQESFLPCSRVLWPFALDLVLVPRSVAVSSSRCS